MDINQFLHSPEFIYLIIIAGMAFLLLFMFRKFRKVPSEIDYNVVHASRSIKDEKFNQTDDKYGLKYLFRGHKCIGRIMTLSENMYEIEKKINTTRMKWQMPTEKLKIFTITFRTPFIKALHLYWHKDILKFTEHDDFKQESNRLVFPDYISFSAIGNYYITMNSIQPLTKVIEAEYMKQQMVATNNLYSDQMSKVSSIKPEFSHEIALQKMRIEEIRAAKQGRILNA